MRCPECSFDNPPAARFCGSCGQRLGGGCPRCGSDLQPGLRFCTSCGASVAIEGELPGAAAEPRRSPTAERRLVSVLFCDLVGFTSLAESLDAEEVRDIQAGYFEAARSVVAHYGGTLEKFIGDAVVALWGAPTAHEDDAERAVRAALELAAAVERLGGAALGQLSARVAVATGEAAVTIGAEGQGMVTGDLVNTAARLQALAPPGGVLVTARTRQVTAGAIEYQPHGELVLKGKSRAVATWLATGATLARRGHGSGHAAPFVGRERELRALVDLYHATVRDRRSRVVSVVGIAGVGKSRLIWEFGDYIESLPELVAWHVGRAPAYGEGIAFAPLVEMIRQRAGIREDDGVAVAQRKLATTLTDFVADEAERAWLEPRLSMLLEPASATAYERDELFAAWRRFFHHVSERLPCLLVVEDLQWADPGLIDFIEHLAEWAPNQPIMVVTLARPELLDHRPTWGAGQRSFTAIHLDRLEDPAMDLLLAGIAPDMPPRVAHRIRQRADGVPLYAVEMVRMLADEGGLAGLQLAHAGAEMEVPGSLHALIAARIDGLPPPERSLVLTGAVLGRRFHPDALAAVSGASDTALPEQLRSLARRELLAMDEEPRSPGRGQLTFLQDLVREVAYKTLSRRERRSLHLAAARYLESLDDDELIEALAAHLVEAHAAAPGAPDAGSIADRARAALRTAAERAMALHAPARAVDHLERALASVEDETERAALWEQAAAAARSAGRFDDAERYLRDLIGWHAAAGHDTTVVRLTAQLASLLLLTQRNRSALAELERAVAALPDLQTEPAAVELSAEVARAHMLQGADAEAVEWAERALAAARRLSLAHVETEALTTRGSALVELGRMDEGLADLRSAIASAQEHGLLSSELRARNNLAWVVVNDDPRVTMETARLGADLARRMGVGEMVMQLAGVACAAAVDVGEWQWARSTLSELFEERLAPANAIELSSTLAILSALAGEADAEQALLDLEPLDPDTDPQLLANIDHARAWIAFVAGRFEESRRHGRTAAGRSLGAQRHAALALVARASLWLGDSASAADDLRRLEGLRRGGRAAETLEETLRAGLAAVSGQRQKARRRYRQAAERWRQLALPPHLALCLLESHRFAGEDDAEAAATLEELNADGLLRLREVGGSVLPA